jgi:uncharacterized membrane protein YqaE (UPF0057 family)
MNNKMKQIFTLAFATTLLFACSTSKKHSNRSFGGGWAEPQVAQTTEKAAEVASTEVQTNNESTPVEINSVAPTSAETSTVSTPSSELQKATVNSAAQKSLKADGFVKKAAKNIWKKQLSKKAAKPMGDNTILYVVIAFFIPFLGVLLYEGELTINFWLSLLLTLLFWLPGFIYALIVILG